MKKEEVVKTNVIKEVYSRVCKSDPYRDAGELKPGLGVNIDDMLQTGVVKDAGEELGSNGIEDPNQIIGRVRDAFDALDASRIIKKYGRKPAQAQSEVNTVINQSSNEPR